MTDLANVTELHASGSAARGVTPAAAPPAESQLLLSLFPGVDLLGRSFRETGFTVVTGPELWLGDDIRHFSGIPGRFDGVIGGPPCQDFSRKRRTAPTGNGVAMLREFLRVVAECDPTWFLIENVPGVPDVFIDGWKVQRFDLTDWECGGTQLRLRHWQYGHKEGWIVRPRRLDHALKRESMFAPAVLCSSEDPKCGYRESCRRQGVSPPLALPFPVRTKLRMIGNGVPMPMGRCVAQAVTVPGPVTPSDCVCRCGRRVTPPARHALPACRKRMERRRRVTRQTVYFLVDRPI